MKRFIIIVVLGLFTIAADSAESIKPNSRNVSVLEELWRTSKLVFECEITKVGLGVGDIESGESMIEFQCRITKVIRNGAMVIPDPFDLNDEIKRYELKVGEIVRVRHLSFRYEKSDFSTLIKEKRKVVVFADLGTGRLIETTNPWFSIVEANRRMTEELERMVTDSDGSPKSDK